MTPGEKERALRPVPQVVGRRGLDLDLAQLRHGGVRPVEGTVGQRRTAAVDEESGRENHAGRSLPHDAGRNTQIAAGSLPAARAATNNRSSSGTNSEVRAPDTVGTLAIRAYPVSRASTTSTRPSPQLT